MKWIPDGGEMEAVSTEPNMQQVVAAVANSLEKLVTRNDQLTGAAAAAAEDEKAAGGLKGRGMAAFRGQRRPVISIEKYLERIHSHVLCSPMCVVIGFVYVDRAAHRRPELLVGSLNVHRLMLTGIMVASKFFDVMPPSNAFYAKVGGVTVEELNHLELELLGLLDYKVNVSSQEFGSYRTHLEKEMSASRLNLKAIHDSSPTEIWRTAIITAFPSLSSSLLKALAFGQHEWFMQLCIGKNAVPSQ